jgi:hypothetical protein
VSDEEGALFALLAVCNSSTNAAVQIWFLNSPLLSLNTGFLFFIKTKSTNWMPSLRVF